MDQRLGPQEKIDAGFDAKTKALNDWQRDELKKKWGTMQHVLSSRSRMDRVVSDIIFDFSAHAGEKILLKSDSFDIMQFRVASSGAKDDASLPSTLRTVERIPESKAIRTRRLAIRCRLVQCDLVDHGAGIALGIDLCGGGDDRDEVAIEICARERLEGRDVDVEAFRIVQQLHEIRGAESKLRNDFDCRFKRIALFAIHQFERLFESFAGHFLVCGSNEI